MTTADVALISIAILGLVGNIFIGLLCRSTHVLVNSRLTELLAVSIRSARSEGKAEGRAIEQNVVATTAAAVAVGVQQEKDAVAAAAGAS
jgi:hypothetical protein